MNLRKNAIAFILIITMLFCCSGTAFAATDPDVTIVNPVNANSVTSANLLISVKMTQPKTIRVSASEVRRTVEGGSAALNEGDMKAILDGTYADSSLLTYSTVLEAETFTSTNNLSFYTKKIEGISPGVYLIRVETISQDKATHSRRSYVTVKSKAEEESGVFDSSQTGTATFLQNLLKSIFKD